MPDKSPSPARPRLLCRPVVPIRWLSLACALSLTACLQAPAAERPVLVVREAPPDLTEPCPRRPERPAAFESLNELLRWALAWGYSGEQCRALSDRQGEWIAHPPGEQ